MITMSASLLLRIASIISFFFAAGHTMGGLKLWSPMGENAVLQSMRAVKFDVMGVSRSYLDFFVGFGYSLTVAQLVQAVILWQMATMARTNAVAVRPMIAVFAIAGIASTILAWRFIFPMPTVFAAVLTGVIIAAYFAAAKSP